MTLQTLQCNVVSHCLNAYTNEGAWRSLLNLPERCLHYGDVIMSAMASQITGVSIVCLTICSGADQRQHQSSASLFFLWIRWPVDSPHKGPTTWKMSPFDVVNKYTTLFMWENDSINNIETDGLLTSQTFLDAVCLNDMFVAKLMTSNTSQSS